MAIKLLRFSASWCAACQAMDAAKTLERFHEAHPDVKIERHILPDDDENATQAQRKADKLSDLYDVKTIPTIIFVDDGDEELSRANEAVTLKRLEKLFSKAEEVHAKPKQRTETDEESDDQDDDREAGG